MSEWLSLPMSFVRVTILGERLAARISELREQGRTDGFDIETNMVKSKNRFGDTVTYAEYKYKENIA